MSETNDPARQKYQDRRKSHWDAFEKKREHWHGWGKAYHRLIEEKYSFLVQLGSKVLEIGCGEGDLLAALRPTVGVGVDFSVKMIKRATTRHPNLHFILADAHELSFLQEKFDFILLSVTINDLWDVQEVFEQIQTLCDRHTRLILNVHSRLWELPIRLAQKLGVAVPTLEQNWLDREDIANLMNLTGFELIRIWQEFLEPFGLPGFDALANRFLARFWPFTELCLTNFFVARSGCMGEEPPKVSVIIPARNEAGNIPAIFEREAGGHHGVWQPDLPGGGYQPGWDGRGYHRWGCASGARLRLGGD